MNTPTKFFLSLLVGCWTGYLAYSWVSGERASLPDDIRDAAASVALAPPPVRPEPQPVILTASIGLPFHGPIPMPPAVSESKAR